MPTCATCRGEICTHEVRCTVCGELRWPYAGSLPDPYVCRRCLSVPPDRRESRDRAAAKMMETKRKKGPESA